MERNIFGRIRLIGWAVLLFTTIVPLVVGVKSTQAQEPKTLTISAKNPGTNNYIVAVGLAKVIQSNTDLKVATVPTKGMSVWIRLYKTGEVDMASETDIDAYEASFGIGEWKKGGPQPLRRLFTGYISNHGIFTRPGKGINSIKDLRGKRVARTSPVPFMDKVALAALEVNGLKPDKDYKAISSGSADQSVSALIEGRIDAYYSTLGGAHAQELKRSGGLLVIPIPEETVALIRQKLDAPSIYYNKIEEALCKEYGLPIGTRTLTYAIAYSCRENLSADIVYKVMRAIFENYNQYAGIHPKLAEITLERAIENPTFPFHEGAIRYYKEKGVWTPEHEKLQREWLAKLGKTK